jgi:lysophospholipase L1-like esterase
MTRLLRFGLTVACMLAAGACSSTHGSAGAQRTPSPSPSPPPPAPATATATSGPHLAYAALGASETFGIGASPITEGYAYRLRDDLRLAPTSFADVGIPGATLGDAYQTELANALAIQPSVCTVFFGVNDIRAGVPLARFTSDLTDLVTTLRRAHARVLVIGIPDLGDLPALRSFRGTDLGALTRQWSSAMQAVATSSGAGFLDLGALSGEIAAHPEEIAPDGLHPSNLGHARLAEVVLAALRSQGDLVA